LWRLVGWFCFGWDTDFALSGVVGKLYDAPLCSLWDGR
jgi:hypothetical protein